MCIVLNFQNFCKSRFKVYYVVPTFKHSFAGICELEEDELTVS